MKTLTCTFTESLNRIATGCLNHIKMILVLTLMLLTQQSHAAAASSGITYTGRILDSSDQPVTASQVYFTITISDPDQKCWLYTEQRLVDMSSSAGNFSFEVGSNDPTTLYGTPSLNNPLGGGPATFADVFDNSKSFTSLATGSYAACTGSYDPSTATDKYQGRVMAIFFRIGAAGTDQALPALRITPVPLAMQAINSVKVNGYDKDHLLRIDQTIGTPVNSDINATQLAEFFRLVNAPGTAYLSAVPSMGGDVTGTVGANTVGKIQNVAVTAPTTGDTGKVLTYNGTNMVWQTAASSAITSINGLTNATQSFAVGTAGTDVAISSAGSTHTLNVPTASATNRGALSSADWTTFNSKQSSSLGAAQVWIGNASGGAQAQTLSGDATVSAAGTVTVDKTQTGTASKILQLDGSGVAVTQGVDVKGAGTGSVSLRYANTSTNTVLTFPASSGTANQFLQTDGTGNLSWASQSAMLPAISAGQVWVGNASGGAEAFSLSGDVLSVSNTGLVTLTAAAGGANKLPLAGGSMSGAINMGGNDITNAGNISMAANKYFGLSANSTDGAVAGQMWYDTGVIKYFDGTTVKSLGVAGAGITNLNGLTAGTQSFVNGTAGNAPAFSSAGSAHTLDIPMASASGSVTAGLISNAEYVALNNKQSSSLAATQVWVGNASGVAEARALSGDITVDNVGLVTANKTTTGQANKLLSLDGSSVGNMAGLALTNTGTVTLSAQTASATYGLTLPAAAPANNQILKSNASGDLSWVTYLAQVSDSAPLANGKMWIGNASGVAGEVTMSGDATIDNAGLLTLKNTGSVGTYSKVVTDAQGRVVSGSALASGDVTTALGYTPLDKAGDTMAGDLGTQNINMAANKYLGLSANSTDGTVAGQMWYDTGVIKYFDGTTVKSLGVAGAGITSLNGLSGVTQTFAVGTAGTDFAISSAGSGHTFNLPSASASNRGALTSADWTTFNAKQSNALSSASVWVGNSSGGAEARALSGDITIDNAGLVTMKNTGSVGSYYKVVTDAQGRVVSGSTSLSATDMPSLNDGTIWIGNSGNTAVGYAMSGDATMSNVGLLTLKNTGSVGTYSKVVTDAQGRIVSGSALASGDVTTALGYTPVNRAGDTMAGALNFGANDITNTGNISMAANKYFGLSANSTDGTAAGQMWYDAGTIKYFDGTTVKSLGVAGAGITSLNGLSAGTQSFAIGTAGNAPAFTSATSTHTLDIPMASASGSVTAGLISNAEYVALNSKQSSSLAAGQMWVGNASGVAQAFSLSGDVASVSNTGSVVVNKSTTGQSNYIMALDGSGVANAYGFGIKGATSGTVTLQAPASPANYSLTFPAAQGGANQVLSNDGSGGLSWATALTGITNSASLTSGKLWVGNASGIAAEVNVSGDATMDNAGVMTLKNTGSVGTYWKVTTDAQGRVVSGSALASGDVTTALGYTPLDKAGDTMAGDLGTQNINMAANKYLGLSANSTDGTVAGQMWYDTGVIKYFDGTTVKSLGVAGAGITTLNGLSGVTQTFAVGTAGTDFAINSAGSGHTFNLPSASASNRGALTSADWTTFNSKQSNSLTSASVWVGNSSGGAEARALSGDVTVSNVGLVTLKNTGSVGSYYKVVTDAQGRVVSGSTSLSATDMPSLNDGTIWIGNSGNTAVGYAMSGDATMSNVGLLTLKNTGSVGTYYKVVTDAQGRVTSGSALTAGDITTALTYTPLNKAGDTMGGALGMGGFDITNAGNITMAANKYFGLSANSTDGTAAGQMWYDAGTIKYFDGTTVKSLGVAGAGITSLNGLSAGTQSFAIGTAGNAPAFTSATSTHTLDIPMASASGSVTAGLISNAEYVALNSKQSSSLAAGQMWVGNASGVAQAFSLSGDVASVSNTGSVVVNKSTTGQSNYIMALDGSGVANAYGFGIKGATSGTVTLQAPASPANYSLTFPAAQGGANQVLSNDGSGGLSWATALTGITNSAALTNGKLWVGNASGKAAEVNVSGDATMDNAGVMTLKNTGSVGTYWKVVTDAQGRVTSGSALASGDVTTALGYTPLDKAGDTMAGDLGTLNINMAANKYLKLSANSTDGTAAGQMWYDTGVIKYFDGTTVKSLGVAGAGITSLNGLSAVSQTFTTGTSGSDFNLSFAGSTHTFNLPSASASNRGALTSADWTTFNSKQSNALTAGSIWVGNSSGGAQAFALSGDIASVTNTGLVTLKNTGSVGTYYKVVTDAQGRVVSGTSSMSNTDLPTLADTKIWIGNSSSTATPYAISGDATMSNVGLLTLKNTGTLGTYYKVVTDAQGRVTSGSALTAGDITTALTYTPVNKAGDTMGGVLNHGGFDITNTGAISMANNKYFTVSNYAGAAGTAAGQLWYDSGSLKYYNGSTAVTLAASGAAITSLNGLTSAAQTFAIGTSGNSPAFSSATNTHTLNIPMASASGSVTAGLLSNAEYVSLSGKQSNALTSTYLWVGNSSGGAQERAISGDITISNVGLVTANKTTTGQADKLLSLDGTGVANVKGLDVQTGTGKVTFQTSGAFTNYVLTLPNTSGAANQVMSNNGSGVLSWVTALTASGIENTASLAAGKIWIGNASGVAAAQTMSGDATISNAGLLTLKNTGTAGTYWKVVTDAQGRVSSGAALASGDVTTALGFTPASTGSSYINGGNTFAGNATIGLNDAYTLGFETSGSTRMTITAAGNVGIGTATPGGTFEVQGGTAAASTTGSAITLKAQNGGSGGAVGGSIYLTPGSGSSSWPDGTVVVTTANGQNGAIWGANNMTNSYATSSASSANPSYALRLSNSFNVNGNTALIEGSVKNSSSLFQESYMGFVSVTGAANYSADFVMGMSTAADAYSERLRVQGSSGKVGIGTSTFGSNLLEVNGTVGATGANMSGTVTSTVASASNAFDAGNGNIKAGAGGTSVAGGGQIYAAAFDNTAGNTIDFNKGNIQTTSYDCGGNITLNNMQSGGSYTLVVTGAGTTKCTLYDGGTLIPDARFAPSNTTRTASSATVYTMIKVGSKVYVSWIPGLSP